MPHLSIEYSSNLDVLADIGGLCRALSDEIAAIGLYPLGGIRVRAFLARDHAIADHHPDNAFADMVFRIAAGRSLDDRKRTGERLMAVAGRHFARQLAGPHFALSLEIVEIAAETSWKFNTIHARLTAAAKPS